jgi:hypothetical protein
MVLADVVDLTKKTPHQAWFCYISFMADKKPSPLQSSFLLTTQEKRYILIICALFLLGIIARYLFLNNRRPTAYTPAGIEEPEKGE